MKLIEDAETAKCPKCGSKYLVNTGYCMSCKKKVADPKKDDKKDDKDSDKEKNDKKKEQFIRQHKIDRIVEKITDKFKDRKTFFVFHDKDTDYVMESIDYDDAFKEVLTQWDWKHEGYDIQEAQEFISKQLKEYSVKDIEDLVTKGIDWPIDNGIATREPDWKDLENQIKKMRTYSMFDTQGSGDTFSVKSIVEYMKEGNFDDYLDQNSDYIENVKDGILESLLRQNELPEVNALIDDYSDEIQELMDAIDAKAVYNYDDLMPVSLFMKDATEFEIPDMSDLYNEDGSLAEEVQKFVDYVTKSGFKEKEALEVISNATYGGMGGVGIIVSGQDLAEAIKTGNRTLNGDSIVYIHDDYNGSGHYIISNKTNEVKYEKDWYTKIDSGQYSLGAVFNTRDWSYK